MRNHRRSRDADRPHVALFVETSINYGRGVLRGIARYLREFGPWSIFLEQHELGAKLPDWIDRWDGDGIITRYDHPQILETKLPTVVLFDRTDDCLTSAADPQRSPRHRPDGGPTPARAGIRIIRLLRCSR